MTDHNTIDCTFENMETFAQDYMPFIKNGGLFLNTAKRYALGDPVTIKLKIEDKAIEEMVACKVVWRKPRSIQDQFQIGIQFQGKEIKPILDLVETYLSEFWHNIGKE